MQHPSLIITARPLRPADGLSEVILAAATAGPFRPAGNPLETSFAYNGRALPSRRQAN